MIEDQKLDTAQGILFKGFLSSVLAVYTLLMMVGLSLAGETDDQTEKAVTHVPELTIFTAKTIITMDTAIERASAVAVADGKIVAVGSLKSLTSWTEGRQVTVDKSFADKVILPGFIDPHVHPSLPAILTQFPFIAPEDWDLPTGLYPAATNPVEYMSRLEKLVAAHDSTLPFVTWGYHPLWHGDIYRPELDRKFPDTPVILWHRSFHELIANTSALKFLGIQEATYQGAQGVNFDKGHFWELGGRLIVAKMPFLFEPKRYAKGLDNFVKMLHRGGVTSAMDMGTGMFGNAPADMAMIQSVMDAKKVPSRIILTPIITDFISRDTTPQEALLEVERWKRQNSQKVFFADHFKLMLDGAIFSGLAQFNYPGYMDGHEGEWLVPPEKSLAYAKAFWEKGYQIHAHTNGDKSTALLIDIIKQLQSQKPRQDHRTTLEHFAYSNQDQLRQLSDLGAAISANPYYQYILSDIYAKNWLGDDRARNMVPLGGAKKLGINVALHSDSPMAPLSPLSLVWTAVNRETINGNSNNKSQSLTVDEAMRAITIDAAWVMGLENEIGSIRAGKRADFVVLDKDPYKIKTQEINKIKVLATIFEGEKFILPSL